MFWIFIFIYFAVPGLGRHTLGSSSWPGMNLGLLHRSLESSPLNHQEAPCLHIFNKNNLKTNKRSLILWNTLFFLLKRLVWWTSLSGPGVKESPCHAGAMRLVRELESPTSSEQRSPCATTTEPWAPGAPHVTEEKPAYPQQRSHVPQLVPQGNKWNK